MNMEGFGKNISLTVNLGILRDGRVLFLRITTDWTGSCGLQHFRLVYGVYLGVKTCEAHE